MKYRLPGINPKEYLSLIRTLFSEEGNVEVAEGQMRYMRNKFPYYGLKASRWVAILKEVFSLYGVYDGEELKIFARLCFKEEYHEMFYAGLQMVEKQLKYQQEDFIDFLEEAILAGSWWDTVDWISKLVGKHFSRYPQLQRPYSEKWIDSKSIWLQRAAIIHQLLLKESTQEQLMFEMVLRSRHSDEFFVRKGAGWALRQHSKIRPQAVLQFIEANQGLSGLTRREGLKWLVKNGDVS